MNTGISSAGFRTNEALCQLSYTRKFMRPLTICVHIEQNTVKFKIAPRKHDSILNICFANNQRPPNNLVSMALSHCHDCLLCGTLPQTINSIIMTGITPKQNAFKFKIAPHKQKSIVKKKIDRKIAPPVQRVPVLKHT